MQPLHFDIRQASRKEFEDFVFEHEVHPIGSSETWYHQFDTTVTYDARHNTRLFIEMFEDAASLNVKYHKPKLEQGLWAVGDGGFDGNLADLIWRSSVPISDKEKLISSMLYVFRDLFAKDPIGSACEMWWDSLAYEINPMRRIDPETNEEHRRIQKAMFDTLTKILEMKERHCQFAALHGLNHVFHPDTESLIRDFVANQPELTDAEVEYAIHCANGTAM